MCNVGAQNCCIFHLFLQNWKRQAFYSVNILGFFFRLGTLQFFDFKLQYLFKNQIVLSFSAINSNSSTTNLLSAELRAALHQVFMKCRMCNKLVETCIYIVRKWMWSVFRPERAAVPICEIASGVFGEGKMEKTNIRMQSRIWIINKQ